ncbi:amidohydrolase [Lacisediminihabitans changchengi]|uniref:Amidohydrolase family protein n=1 Tax=Lacisediminihabitans changchengi TaxID=2787634 RepID=A0A934SPW7_9MICO|nr:amidohydrolase family protein [Lacisediminihabitans changchengi]MBK4346019.1 amidohydrolase family protein [Lacisediminihabitans changchengi]
MSLTLRNARLVGTEGEPVDVVISDGAVASIGAGSPDESLDLDGRYLGPGLWDNHVHFSQWSLVRQRLDVSAAGSAAETVRLVADRLASGITDGTTLVGYGFRDGLWPDVPAKGLLDGLTGAIPVALVSGDLHCVWLNSAALERFGRAGHPTGILREQEAFEVNTAISTVADDVLDGWVADAATAAAARGIVGIVDLEMQLTIDDWPRRIAAGIDQLRVRCGVYSHDLETAIARGLQTGRPLEGAEGLATMGPFKIITDGSLNTRTAYCHAPYPGTHNHGELVYAPLALVALLERARDAGLVPAVHAIGDFANELALDAFQTAAVRGSIEHAQLVSTSDFARFAELGVVASVQPEHAMDDRDIADVYWAGRTDRAFALQGLARAGATLRLGSDAPVAPLDPWVTMAAAISRSRDGREPWHPEQIIAAEVAFAASTDGRARVEVGSIADLVVTERNPLTATDDELRSFPVTATMVAGRWTHTTL